MKYTIIILNYNNEKTIQKCIDSAINQTYNKYNIIIVDDGSTDNSRNIINKYKKIKNISIYYKENTGVADSRNFAIEKVKTKYFTFLDSDDYIETNLLEECEKYNNYDILEYSHCEINEKGKILKKIIKDNYRSNNGLDNLINHLYSKKQFLVPWGYIYKKELFTKNNIKYPINYVNEDISITAIALYNAKKFISTSYLGYYYVQTKNSITRNHNNELLRMESRIYQYKFLKNYLNNKKIDNDKKNKILVYYINDLIWFNSTLNKKNRKIYKKMILDNNIFESINDSISIKIIKKTIRININLTRIILKFVSIFNKIRKK